MWNNFFARKVFASKKFLKVFRVFLVFLFDRFTAKDDRKELGRVERDRLITSLVAINLTIRNSEGEKIASEDAKLFSSAYFLQMKYLPMRCQAKQTLHHEPGLLKLNHLLEFIS